jgi:hypothetical protein
MASTRFSSYSIISAFFWRVGNDCLAYGQLDPNSTLTGDTISHALGYVGSIGTVDLPQITYKDFTFGQADFVGRSVSGTEPVSSFTMNLSEIDLNLGVLAHNATISTTTINNANVTSIYAGGATPNSVGLMFSAAIESRGSGCDGAKEYRTFVIPRAQISVNYGSLAVDAGNDTQPATVTVFPTKASNHPWGTAFGSAENFAGNKTWMYEIIASKPYALTTYIADGTETTFEVEYVPASSAVTDGDTDNVFSIDGVVTAPTSISTTTGVVTIAAAGSDGDVHTAFYQIDAPHIRTV